MGVRMQDKTSTVNAASTWTTPASCSYLLPNVEDSHVKLVHWQDDRDSMWFLQHPATTPCTHMDRRPVRVWTRARSGMNSETPISGLSNSWCVDVTALQASKTAIWLHSQTHTASISCLWNTSSCIFEPPLQSMHFMTQDGAGCMLSISVRKSINLG